MNKLNNYQYNPTHANYVGDHLNDLLILAGKEDHIDLNKHVSAFLPGAHPDSDQYKEAFAAITSSFQSYANQLPKDYPAFLNMFKKELPKLYTAKPMGRKRIVIAEKLRADSAAHIDQVESHYSRLYQLLHKIMQWSRGNGFRTTGEQGIQLALDLKQFDFRVLVAHTHAMIPKGKKDSLSEKKIGELVSDVNRLSASYFKALVKQCIFDQKVHHKKNRAGSNNKYLFYKHLTDNKKAIFIAELKKREDSEEQYSDLTRHLTMDAADQDLTSLRDRFSR